MNGKHNFSCQDTKLTLGGVLVEATPSNKYLVYRLVFFVVTLSLVQK